MSREKAKNHLTKPLTIGIEGPRRALTECTRWGERRHRLPVYLAERYKPMHTDCRTRMGKVFFDTGIDSVQGILIGTDPFYIRRYPGRDGEIMHIVQARPDRSSHQATPAEAANRVAFGIVFGKERHREFIARTMKGQLEIEFLD